LTNPPPPPRSALTNPPPPAPRSVLTNPPPPPRSVLTNPPPAPRSVLTNPPPPRSKPGPDDVDWEDDDEVTSVYNPEAHGNPAGLGPLPQSDPPPPPGPPRSRPMEVAPPPSSRVEVAPPRSRPEPPPPTPRVEPVSAPRREAFASPVPARRSRPNRTALVIVGLALAVAVGTLVWAFVPRQGVIAVNVSGPGGTAIEMVSILVDDAERCSDSACRIEVAAGTPHKVRVIAPGFQKAADKFVVIPRGGTAVVDFSLSPLAGGAGGGGTGTGVRVGDLGAGLRLSVDGVDRGPLPASATDLSPGEHTIRIDGSDRFQVWEERVTVEGGSVRLLEPTLRATKGMLSVELGANANGATTTLVCDGDRRLLQPPTKVEIDLEKTCVVVAKKPPSPDFSADVRFSGTRAEATVTIQFTAGEVAPPPGPVATRPPAWLPGAQPADATPPATQPPPPTAPTAAAGTGTISINSIPVSSVLVDGKPVGQTPTRVTVPAGPHSVTFIHPEKGRKSVGVQVPAGGNATAVTRF